MRERTEEGERRKEKGTWEELLIRREAGERKRGEHVEV